MSGIFLDTNIVLYTIGEDQEKSQKAAQLFLNKPSFSVQVLNESRNVLIRKMKYEIDVAQSFLDFVITKGNCIPFTVMDFHLSWNLMKEYNLSHWDSLIVSHAVRNQGKILYSEDMHHDLLVQGQLLIQNPFVI